MVEYNRNVCLAHFSKNVHKNEAGEWSLLYSIIFAKFS